MKKIFKTMLITVLLLACVVTAHAAPSEPEGYPITVNDWETPAVFAAGKDWPITTWYLYAGDGTVLGSIPAHVVTKLVKDDPTGSIQWEVWLAEAFNEYRRTNGPAQIDQSSTIQKPAPVRPRPQSETETAEEKELAAETEPSTGFTEEFDAEAFALEAFGLINEARTENGLHEVELNEKAMELARMRVPELEEQYDHIRPDGSRMSQTYRCGEIINRRASTPQIAVDSWLDSTAHREMILDERYHSAGIACHQGTDGVTYWCMLFRK